LWYLFHTKLVGYKRLLILRRIGTREIGKKDIGIREL